MLQKVGRASPAKVFGNGERRSFAGLFSCDLYRLISVGAQMCMLLIRMPMGNDAWKMVGDAAPYKMWEW